MTHLLKFLCLVWLVLVEAGVARGVDEAAVGLKVRRQSGINYVTGGLGEEAKAFSEIAGRYPVHIRLSVGGVPLQDKGTRIRVLDVKGDALVDAEADGPLFFVNPSSGRWTFEAERGGQKQVQTKDLTGRRYLDISFDFVPSD